VGVDARTLILSLLAQRAAGATICPSEVARAMDEDWRPLMPAVREAAAGLVASGDIEVTQGGEVVALESARGPIRLRRA
jgi:hypothetical protein